MARRYRDTHLLYVNLHFFDSSLVLLEVRKKWRKEEHAKGEENKLTSSERKSSIIDKKKLNVVQFLQSNPSHFKTADKTNCVISLSLELPLLSLSLSLTFKREETEEISL